MAFAVLVENNPGDILLLREILSDLPITEVITLSTADEVRQFISEESISPAFVFVDHNIPQVDGGKLIPELISAYPSAKIIYWSRDPVFNGIDPAVVLAHESLPKPMEYEELKSVVVTLVQSAQVELGYCQSSSNS